MMKGLLIFIVFSCCAWGGVSLYRSLKERADTLEALAEAITSLAEAMDQDGLTLREGLQWLQGAGGRQEGRMLAGCLLSAWALPGPLPERWGEAAGRLCQHERGFRRLNPQEQEWLKHMIQDQAAASADPEHIRRGWVRQWQERALQARTQYEKKGPLYGKLGMLIGAALAILML